MAGGSDHSSRDRRARSPPAEQDHPPVFYDDWSSRQVWASGTRTAMDLALRSSELGTYQLGRVGHSHVEQWVKRMAAQPLAAGTIKTRYNNVRSIFRAAVRDRLIVRDPTENVRLPRQRRPEASMTIPTVEEVGALLDAADAPLRTFVALCAFAGLRLGEAAAVQVSDIDFLRRKLNLTRQVQRVSAGEIEIKAPKYGSERVVHLPDQLVAMLAHHVDAYTDKRAAQRWLFHGEPGYPPDQNTVGYWWRLTQKNAGLAGIRLHDLRLGAHRGRPRRRHRAARTRSRGRHDDAADLRPPVADGRGSDPKCGLRTDAFRDLGEIFCGLFAD